MLSDRSPVCSVCLSVCLSVMLVHCGQTVGQIKMVLGSELGLSPGDFVLDGDPAPPQKGGGAPPQFWAHVYCDQTTGWIKMALGMELSLGPGHIVLD